MRSASGSWVQCSLHTQELAGAESGDGFPGKGRGAENRTQGRAVGGGKRRADTEGFPLGRPAAPAPGTLRDLCVLRAELNLGLCVPSCFYVQIKKVAAFVFGSGLGFFLVKSVLQISTRSNGMPC